MLQLERPTLLCSVAFCTGISMLLQYGLCSAALTVCRLTLQRWGFPVRCSWSGVPTHSLLTCCATVNIHGVCKAAWVLTTT